ncbi:predicted protein [Arabidopsis lyrata subsp. lyrata]|uniref:Predicted protein n=1 Tax=Arabidopsis lyrata subsp. lyrata TaxID=81972 RepID=D7MTQ6_ARALL|nr:predicted protein [Arabidopsis lyrata subsp. lyrata]
MVKVGSYLEDADSLVAKLKQSSVAVHGFPLAIQLFALKYIPLLLTILPNGEDQSTFLDRIIHHLPKCKSFHTSNILRLEYSSNLCVLHPQNPDPAFVASEHCDPKVKELERLIASSFQFTKDVWSGGDASMPSLTSSRKRKSIPSRSASSSSGPEDFCKQKKRVGHRSSVKIRGNADTLIEKHLKSFKASLLVELSHLIQHSHQSTRRGVPPVNKSSIVSPAVSSSPVRNTRSGCAGLSAGSFSKRSASNTRSSSSNAKHSPICHPAVGFAHTVLSPGKCLESMVDPEAVGFTDFQHLDTDVLPPEHIDCIVSFLWQKHGAFLATRRITVLDSMFTSMMDNKFVNFSQHVNTLTYAWHPLLTAYVCGLVDGRTYCTSARKVASYMAPIAQMLPCLLRSVCEDVPSTWPATGFTFTRMIGLAQNDRGGDCGPMSLKFIELHSHQLTSHLQELTKKTVNNIRMRYAIDLYEEYVSRV